MIAMQFTKYCTGKCIPFPVCRAIEQSSGNQKGGRAGDPVTQFFRLDWFWTILFSAERLDGRVSESPRSLSPVPVDVVRHFAAGGVHLAQAQQHLIRARIGMQKEIDSLSGVCSLFQEYNDRLLTKYMSSERHIMPVLQRVLLFFVFCVYIVFSPCI